VRTTVEISEWAARNQVSTTALMELLELLADNDHSPEAADPDKLASEARQQSIVRLEAPKHGVWLTRNNVGVLPNPDTGRPVRYGLANESKAQNQVVKSADLIGFRKRVILPTDVGTVIAQFVSRECKAEGWKFKGTARELAQQRWRDFININGGDAAFASGPGSFNY
jgi:hypothetical protein